jgi:HD domain
MSMAFARLRQGLRALSSPVIPVDDALVAAVLSPSLREVFRSMRRSEQQHSINVLQTLRGWGYDHPSLIVAALLHDAGKARAAYHLWDRVLVVLLRAIVPYKVARWGYEIAEPVGWRRPFVINAQHPRWSAEMAEVAGADPLAVELIARHQRKLRHEPQNLTEQLLVALQAADNAN